MTGSLSIGAVATSTMVESALNLDKSGKDVNTRKSDLGVDVDGHANLYLAAHWQLMGSLEALNGWILFGLTAAVLFAVIQKLWPSTRRGGG